MSENGKHGKELDQALGQLPALMGELMRDFVEKKDLNLRVQIRLRMKALLDLAFVDTVWPANPSLKKSDGHNQARDMAMADSDAAMMQGPAVTPMAYASPSAVYAVPGAPRSDDNAI